MGLRSSYYIPTSQNCSSQWSIWMLIHPSYQAIKNRLHLQTAINRSERRNISRGKSIPLPDFGTVPDAVYFYHNANCTSTRIRRSASSLDPFPSTRTVPRPFTVAAEVAHSPTYYPPLLKMAAHFEVLSAKCELRMRRGRHSASQEKQTNNKTIWRTEID